MRVFKRYLVLVPASSFQRVGLRYINQILLPGERDLDIDSFITLNPPIPPDIDRTLLNFYQRYELLHDDPEGVLIHQTGMQSAEEGRGALVLDLDFGTLPDATPEVSKAGPWLSAAHDRIEEAFVASVNPVLLKKMKKGD
jgi:uncharacterized protein (TIGR04255 family)